jgi:hypothetical protein
MGGINSLEGQPSMCGAVVRRWLAGDTTGRNAENTGENTGRSSGNNASNARARRWSLQATPQVGERP